MIVGLPERSQDQIGPLNIQEILSDKRYELFTEWVLNISSNSDL